MTDSEELSGEELLEDLGIELTEEVTEGYTSRQGRIVSGFEDILRFYEANRRAPRHTPGGDIFERLYAVRLDQIRKLPPDELALLLPIDSYGLLEDSAKSGVDA